MHNVTTVQLKYENYSPYDVILKSLNQALAEQEAFCLFALICQNLFSTEQLFEPGQLKGSC